MVIRGSLKMYCLWVLTIHNHVQISHLIDGLIIHICPIQAIFELIDLVQQFALNVRIKGKFMADETKQSGARIKASQKEQQTLRRQIVILPHCG